MNTFKHEKSGFTVTIRVVMGNLTAELYYPNGDPVGEWALVDSVAHGCQWAETVIAFYHTN